ncbi:methylated-DNA--protein-cysteine methyltransferase-related protein [Marinobacter nitratireducens]|uniref:Methylated-DNA--protein-cysteine methyltransferase-related protein n=1 Tax=Marinobacter nitratireducens TaxID=1137280 RepID=A0A072N402_9GAMM|nr:MGMT family protein [Marinobacter nitratireducens]KEF31693.1 methylated-DNA--protein-cysteine methyltransferase-related protein [Marinobacter nitratireducens]
MEESKDQKIWQVVLSIPKGKVASYGQVAKMAGLGRQARYIGRALGKLPAGHQIPWYRVLRSNGQIAFPEGSEQFEKQKTKLEQEGVKVERGRVKLNVHQWRP